MSAIPWRVAAQSYTVLNPDTKEPIMTLQFISDTQSAETSRLRITPAGDEGAPAIEVEFATGGYPVGPAYLQPRWLKAFERPTAVNAEQRVTLAKRREAWLENRELSNDANKELDGSYRFREPTEDDLAAWEANHGPEKDADGNEIRKRPNVGPDGVADGEDRDPPDEKVIAAAEEGRAPPAQQKDAFSPDAAQQRQAGLDSTSPSDSDRKGMVGMGPGSAAPSVEGGAGQAYNPSPGITPAPNQGAGQMTGGPGPMPGGAPQQGQAGGGYATDPNVDQRQEAREAPVAPPSRRR